MPTHPTHAQGRLSLGERTDAHARAAFAAALLTGVIAWRDDDDSPLPPEPPADASGLAEEDRQLLAIAAALKVVGIRQIELARRLGISDGRLSMKLTGLLPTTETERHIIAYALFQPDRDEVAKV